MEPLGTLHRGAEHASRLARRPAACSVENAFRFQGLLSTTCLATVPGHGNGHCKRPA